MTYSYPKVTYSEPRVTYSYPKMTYIDPRVTHSDPTHFPLPPPTPLVQVVKYKYVVIHKSVNLYVKEKLEATINIALALLRY